MSWVRPFLPLRDDCIGNGFCQRDIDSSVICHKWCEIDLNCEFNSQFKRKHTDKQTKLGKSVRSDRVTENLGGIRNPDICVKNNMRRYLNEIYQILIYKIYQQLRGSYTRKICENTKINWNKSVGKFPQKSLKLVNH